MTTYTVTETRRNQWHSAVYVWSVHHGNDNTVYSGSVGVVYATGSTVTLIVVMNTYVIVSFKQHTTLAGVPQRPGML